MIKQRKRSLSKVLSFIGTGIILCGLILLSLHFILGFWEKELPSTFYIKIPVYCYCEGSGEFTTILKVQITFTPKTTINQSTSLLVSLATGDYHSSLKPDAGQTQLDSAVAVDPHSNFEAQLSASAFDIDPQKQIPISLSTEDGTLFGWSIIPKYAGAQTLLVSIIARDNQGAHTLEISVIHVTVNAAKTVTVTNITSNSNDALSNFFNLSQVTLGGLLIALLGSVLNIPWIVEYYKKKKEAEKEKRKPKQTLAPQTIKASPLMTSASSPPAKKEKKKRGQSQRP